MYEINEIVYLNPKSVFSGCDSRGIIINIHNYPNDYVIYTIKCNYKMQSGENIIIDLFLTDKDISKNSY